MPAFSADDLVKILSAFRDSGCTHLEYNGLHLDRDEPTKVLFPAAYRPTEEEVSHAETPYSAPRQESPPEIPLTTPEEQDDLDNEQLLIEDPVEFERKLLKGDIEYVGDGAQETG